MNNEVHLTLPGSIRIKKNSKMAMIVGGVHKPRKAVLVLSKQYRKWEKEIREVIGLTYRGGLKQGPLHVQVIAYFRGKQPDLSGCLESVGDALEGIVWEDDTQIRSWDGSRVFHDKHNPRTEVIVRPYQPHTCQDTNSIFSGQFVGERSQT